MAGGPRIEAAGDARSDAQALEEGKTERSAGERTNYVVATVLVALAFLVSGEIGHLVAIPPGMVTPIWLPSGFALVGVLLFGARIWPGIWVAAFMAYGLPAVAADSGLELVRSFVVGIGIATGSTLEPILGASLYTLVSGRVDVDPLSSVRRLAALLVLAGCVSCSVNATIGVTTLSIAGLVPWSAYGSTWLTWWIGNTVGVILVAPLVLSWRKRPAWLSSLRASLKPVLLLVTLTFVSEILFGEWLGRRVAVPLVLMTMPLLIWLAYSYGRRAATLGGALVATVALVNTAQGQGPFVGENLNESLLLLQFCLAMMVITGLAMSAAVSERRAAERQARRLNSTLAHAGRLSLTGEMAAGIAHEFHQPLAVIANYANSCLIRLRRGEPLGEEARVPLENIVNETMRAARVIRGIRGFLKKSEQHQAQTDINMLVSESLELAMLADGDSGVTVSMDLDGQSPSAWVEPTQITQVMVNLLVNAIDAMVDVPTEGKRIDIATHSKMDSVEVRVADGGPGIAEEDREKCFERFYTTKRDGLGMGLAICRTLVEHNGGRLWVENSARGGAVFCFNVSKTPVPAEFEGLDGKF